MYRFLISIVVVLVIAPLSYARDIKSVSSGDTLTARKVLEVKKEDRVLGKKDAPVTIVEYASLGCSHCASFNNAAFPKLKEQYIDAGKVRFVYRDFPLNYPSLLAGKIARCAPEDKFFQIIKSIYKTQSNWVGNKNYLEVLSNIAKLAGMKSAAIEVCLQDKKLETYLIQEKADAAKVLQIDATPSFFINGKKLEGGYKLENFVQAIEKESGVRSQESKK